MSNAGSESVPSGHRAGKYASRSAAVQDAVRLLRESRLADAYAEAFADGYDAEWDAADADGLASA